jgi:hypothetical protein
MSQLTDQVDEFTYVVAGTPEAAVIGWSPATRALVDDYQTSTNAEQARSEDGAR